MRACRLRCTKSQSRWCCCDSIESLKTVRNIILIYFFLMAAILFVLYRFAGKDVDGRIQNILLRDDGYATLAKDFVQYGTSLLHREVGPGLPLVYAPAFLLPDKLQPAARYFTSVFLNIFSLLLLFLIMRRLRLIETLFGIAAIILFIHPVFIHWTIKSAPEPLVTLLLLLFAYLILCGKRFWPGAAAVFLASIFVRPTFLFIPLAMLALGKADKNKTLMFFSALLITLTIFGYWLNNKITVQPYLDDLTTYSSGLHEIIMDAYFVDNVVKTRRFTTGSRNWPDGNRPMAHQQYWQWLRANREPNDNRFSLIWKFVEQHPRLMLQKALFNPLFFLSMCSSSAETWITFIYNLVLLSFGIFGVFSTGLSADQKLLLTIALGYFFIFWIGHAYSRYIYALLPFLAMFAAHGVIRLDQHLSSILYRFSTSNKNNLCGLLSSCE